MTEWIEKLRQWVAESDNMVFFGGAGVSTESGIPDFRSVDGLYHQKFRYPPETILSHSFYVRHKAEFYDFYRAKMLAPWGQPHAAHKHGRNGDDTAGKHIRHPGHRIHILGGAGHQGSGIHFSKGLMTHAHNLAKYCPSQIGAETGHCSSAQLPA